MSATVAIVACFLLGTVASAKIADWLLHLKCARGLRSGPIDAIRPYIPSWFLFGTFAGAFDVRLVICDWREDSGGAFDQHTTGRRSRRVRDALYNPEHREWNRIRFLALSLARLYSASPRHLMKSAPAVALARFAALEVAGFHGSDYHLREYQILVIVDFGSLSPNAPQAIAEIGPYRVQPLFEQRRVR